jgi:hypothetical protein
MNVFKSSPAPDDIAETPAPPPTVIPSELSYTPQATLASLAVQLPKPVAGADLDSIIANWRASCFIAA